MFLPAWFGLMLLLCWLVVAALAGALVGRVGARALGLPARRGWADAAAGVVAVLLVFGLTLVVSGVDTVVVQNGETQGWRGALLDHMLLWSAVAVCAAVVGLQLVGARRHPRRPGAPPGPVRAPGAPAGPGAPAA